MELNPERVLANARKAPTKDLLNRVTAFRAGMEPEALLIIEAELHRRGIQPEEIADFNTQVQNEVIFLEDGTGATCSYCHNPAIEGRWGWHHLFKLLPLFPRWYYLCEDHLGKKRSVERKLETSITPTPASTSDK